MKTNTWMDWSHIEILQTDDWIVENIIILGEWIKEFLLGYVHIHARVLDAHAQGGIRVRHSALNMQFGNNNMKSKMRNSHWNAIIKGELIINSCVEPLLYIVNSK